MKLDSELFDRIRVKPGADRTAVDTQPRCDLTGCRQPGAYRAPKGRGREGQYFCFCLDHVRDYNKSYNYFAGMTDRAVTDYIKASATGHRPTWTMGTRSAADRNAPFPDFRCEDPLDLFRGEAGGRADAPPVREERVLRPAERRSLEALSLEETATAPAIKARFKELVKRFHPDLNGGDRRSEDKLRDIIQAHNCLRAAGLC